MLGPSYPLTLTSILFHLLFPNPIDKQTDRHHCNIQHLFLSRKHREHVSTQPQAPTLNRSREQRRWCQRYPLIRFASLWIHRESLVSGPESTPISRSSLGTNCALLLISYCFPRSCQPSTKLRFGSYSSFDKSSNTHTHAHIYRNTHELPQVTGRTRITRPVRPHRTIATKTTLVSGYILSWESTSTWIPRDLPCVQKHRSRNG
jgi:hypothetical protein